MKILWIFLFICSCAKNNARKETEKPAETEVSAKESEVLKETEALMKYEEYLESLRHAIDGVTNGNYTVLDKFFVREDLHEDSTLTMIFIYISGTGANGGRVTKIEEIFLTNGGKNPSWENQYRALFLNDEEILIPLEEWESLPMTCRTFKEKIRSFYLETNNQVLQSKIEEFFHTDLSDIFDSVASIAPEYSNNPEENCLLYSILFDAYKEKTALYYYIMDKLILPQDSEKRRTALLNMIAFSFSTSELRRIYQGAFKWYLSENWLCPEINDQSQTKW